MAFIVDDHWGQRQRDLRNLGKSRSRLGGPRSARHQTGRKRRIFRLVQPADHTADDMHRIDLGKPAQEPSTIRPDL